MCTRSGIVVKQVGLHVEVFPRRCKSWSCPDCSKLRRRSLIREGKDGKPNRFITLTVNPAWFSSPEERAAQLSKAWRLVVAAFRHRWPMREAEYLAIFEATQKGEPHLHILWRGGWVDQRWLSAQLRERMGAPIVDVRQVKGEQQVAEYVTKYVSKRNVKFGTLKRYWRSKKYLPEGRRAALKKRNAGALYHVLSRHFLQYLEQLVANRITFAMLRPDQLEYELPPGRASPVGSWLEQACNFVPRAA